MQDSRSPSPRAGHAAAGGPLGAPVRRVLVVDDNIDAASTVADLLALAGSEVEVVHDGLSAVAHAGRFRPDVVLLDIGLPDIDGYEVAGRIRAIEGLRQPLLIAMTGWSQEQDRQRSAQAGIDQHWTKPVDPQRLLALAASEPVAASHPPA